MFAMKKWLQDQRTDPHITDAILYNLKKGRKSGGLFPHNYQDKRLRKAIKEQTKIEWNQFMLGRINQRWSALQLRYDYKSIHVTTVQAGMTKISL
jgi:hypothetical protein